MDALYEIGTPAGVRRAVDLSVAEIDAYFEGADSGMARARQYLHCILRPARGCLDDFEAGYDPGGLQRAIDLLLAARKDFEHFREQLDPVGGPKSVRSLEPTPDTVMLVKMNIALQRDRKQLSDELARRLFP